MQHFWHSQTGAATVEWVVLTAAVTGLGLATTSVVADGLENLTNNIVTQLTNQGVIVVLASTIPHADWTPYASASWDQQTTDIATYDDATTLQNAWDNARASFQIAIDGSNEADAGEHLDTLVLLERRAVELDLSTVENHRAADAIDAYNTAFPST